MRERQIEKRLRLGIEALDGLCDKFTSPARRGVPDRLITLTDGTMVLVETKAPDGVLSDAQQRDHARRATKGVLVHVLSTPGEVDEFLRCCRIYLANV